MTKTLRHRPLKNYLPIVKEMEFADDRTAAIVAASLVENNLALVISTRLRQFADDAEKRRLFDNSGALLSTFSNKIDMGFALNLYDRLVRDDLDRIREIRNQFAHHLDVRDFNHSDVAGKCDALNAPKYFNIHFIKRPKEPTRKQIYIDTAAFLATNCDMECKKAHQPPKPMFLVYTVSEDH